MSAVGDRAWKVWFHGCCVLDVQLVVSMWILLCTKCVCCFVLRPIMLEGLPFSICCHIYDMLVSCEKVSFKARLTTPGNNYIEMIWGPATLMGMADYSKTIYDVLDVGVPAPCSMRGFARRLVRKGLFQQACGIIEHVLVAICLWMWSSMTFTRTITTSGPL